jgi:hypothetical protein
MWPGATELTLMPLGPSSVARLCATRLAGYRQAAGTADRPFEVHAISADAYTPDGVRRLQEQGVTDVIVGVRWAYQTGPDPEPLADKLTKLRRFADAVIARTPGTR